MWTVAPALIIATLMAQASPFDGTWTAEVPSPGGDRVKFVLQLTVEDDELTGTLQIGNSKPVAIENGRVREDVISFKRTLDGDAGETVQFLARVLDDGLHVGFMRRLPPGAPPQTGSTGVVNFVAKRVAVQPRR